MIDTASQLNTYRSFLNLLGDQNAKEESKLKAAQELAENFEVIKMQGWKYPAQ